MFDLTRWIFLLQIGSTFAMVGLIWFVQIVHYPLFAQVGSERFVEYEESHCRLTSFVVVPLMLTELATSILLLWFRPSEVATGTVVLGISLVAVIWLVTFLIQVPQHSALSLAYDPEIQRRLVLGNWLRTAGWTARGGLVLWMIWQVMGRLPLNVA